MSEPMSEPQPVIQRIRLRSDGPLLAVREAIYVVRTRWSWRCAMSGRAGRDVLQTIIEALTRLRDTRPGSYLVPAYRSVPIDGGDGNSVERLLLCTYGGQELATASEAHFSEEEVLRFANSHATLLAELHRAGFSGFRPQLEDIVWREDGRDWTFYGWEGVRRDTCYAVGDLGAAGRLLGAPSSGAPCAVHPTSRPVFRSRFLASRIAGHVPFAAASSLAGPRQRTRCSIFTGARQSFSRRGHFFHAVLAVYPHCHC